MTPEEYEEWNREWGELHEKLHELEEMTREDALAAYERGIKGVTASTAMQASSRGYCPTLCDDDCDALCHEVHQVRWKRSHEPDDCPAHLAGSTRKERM